MNKLTKIKDVSSQYGVTARSLRYYEDMELLSSTRNEEYSYRLYDEDAIRRLEQILILRKLNISIKDIQQIFRTSSSDIVLDVLEKKVHTIENDISLLRELKGIILDFIKEIQRVNFSDDSGIEFLYSKAQEIEAFISRADYSGKPSQINRLIEISKELDNKIPDVIVVNIQEFKAITSGEQPWEKMFENSGFMHQLWMRKNLYKSVIFDCFDFLIPKGDNAEWICAIRDDVIEEDVYPLKTTLFPGGLYAMAVSIDEDDESMNKVQEKIHRWLDNTNFVFDESRFVMLNMPYVYEDGADTRNKDIERGLGYKQQLRYIPIRLKDDL